MTDQDPVITVIDYGVGNLASVANMIRKAGGVAEVTGDPARIRAARRLLLPGVGAFDTCRATLDAHEGVVEAILDKVQQGRPVLGICVGMQMLSNGSDEGKLPGLGLIPGRARRFDFTARADASELKVPHMGWSVVQTAESSRLFRGVDDRHSRFYFVHSYHVVCDEARHVAATADYGTTFTAGVERENVFGAQFHPEKSHSAGLEFFRRFLALA